MTDASPIPIHSVLDLYADYALCLDERRFEAWPEFFVEECLYEVRSRENHDLGLPAALILCESRGALEDRIQVLVDTLTFRYLHMRHLITNIRVHEETADGLKTSASYLVLQTTEEGVTSIFNTGKYEDEISRSDGILKFKRKRVIADTFAIDNLLAVPL